MRNIDKQQIIIIVVAVISLGGFGVLRYRPLAAKTRSIKAARAQFLTGDEKVKTQARQLPILNAKMEQKKKQIGDYDRKIPFGRRFASLYDEITAVMKKHNLSEQLIQPGRETVGEEISSIPITINCSGGLKDIFEFFRSIESFDRLIRIEDIEMVSELDQDIVAVKAGAIVYYRRQSSTGQENKI
ncbi:MAG: type 4a pilus biogenesis protein PilO [Planctomycetes bacterium]|nr:type 4a pilus biogenesis protein PilO [Planctomycetota bacterium]